MNSRIIGRGRAAVLLMLALVLLAFTAVSAVRAQDTAPAAATVPGELVIYRWTTPVQKSHHGFPWHKPPHENGNWVSPVNYAGGTIHFRFQVRNTPQPQSMRLQFCFWQNRSSLETCSRTQVVTSGGPAVTWSQTLGGMWKKNNRPLDWTRPRDRNGVAIKNMNGKPVSDYAGWNWNGENPANWYPMNVNFTVVVVAKGKTFSGWQNY